MKDDGTTKRIAMVEKYPVFSDSSARSKHTLFCNHYPRDLIQQGRIELEYKIFKEIIADGIKKATGGYSFSRVCRATRANER